MHKKDNIKQQLLDYCKNYVDDKLYKLKDQINSIQESLLNEIKSTAGDKHETGRAMVQLEREKIGQQLFEAEKLQELMNRISIQSSSTVIRLGSLVLTSQANYFIAVSAGKIDIENSTYFAISPHTPIGKLLLGKKANDQVIFNKNTFYIHKIT